MSKVDCSHDPEALLSDPRFKPPASLASAIPGRLGAKLKSEEFALRGRPKKMRSQFIKRL